jgi:tRNA pseudouridine38-40 synthase
MTTWKLTLEYDGTKYHGWQEQANAPRTVQGVLRKAAEEFFGLPVEIMGSGRTDSGVHALAQVAHLKARFPDGKTPRFHPEQIRRGLNDRLPADVCILEVEAARARFHARHDATARTYLYQISTRRTAFSKKYVWWVKEKLDVPRMAQVARMLVGRHNFICFRAADPARPDESTIVVVESAEVDTDDHLILFRISASHYLWKMVRRIVGVLVKVGLGEVSLEQFGQLLEARCDPKLDVAAWTAPASGLFLESVQYPDSQV